MNTVRQLLKNKGKDIWSIAQEETAYKALQIMDEKDVGALLVLDGGKVVGIFSERDYARKVILKDKASKDTPVRDLMTHDVIYIEDNATIEECMALMTAKHIRHLPVFENDKLIGLVTIGDVVKRVISDQEYTIEQLERYISKGF